MCNGIYLVSMDVKDILLGLQYLRFNYKARGLLGAMNEPDIHTRKFKFPSGQRADFLKLSCMWFSAGHLSKDLLRDWVGNKFGWKTSGDPAVQR